MFIECKDEPMFGLIKRLFVKTAPVSASPLDEAVRKYGKQYELRVRISKGRIEQVQDDSWWFVYYLELYVPAYGVNAFLQRVNTWERVYGEPLLRVRAERETPYRWRACEEISLEELDRLARERTKELRESFPKASFYLYRAEESVNRNSW